IGPSLQARRNEDPALRAALLDAHVFLHCHGVEAAWHDSAGENAHGAVERRRAVERMASRSLACDPEPYALLPVVGAMGEGVTVDGGIVVGRDGSRRDECLGEKTSG